MSSANHPYVRRNALVLSLAQSMGGALTSINIALGGLVGVYLLSAETELATLGVTTMIVGTACGTLPAAFILHRIGRKLGFMLGALLSGVGGLVAFAAIMTTNFPLFCVGTFLGGFSFAFVQQYRFAATEGASDNFRPKAISYVLAGGILAGVIGPQTVIATQDMFAPVAYAGAYLAQSVLCIVTLILILFYRAVPAPERPIAQPEARSLRLILRQPKVARAILVALASYSVMSLMMTAAPLAIIACGFVTADAALGIQWHVIAMFAPSFFTGSLINRFGEDLIAAIGLVLLALAGVVALTGITLAHFYVALVLLGLGWNFGFIGGTAMLTKAQRPEERMRTQAANEFIVFGAVAIASLSSGFLFQTVGWAAINWTLLPIVLLPLLLIAVGHVRRWSASAPA